MQENEMQLKTKDSGIKPYPFCLGSMSENINWTSAMCAQLFS